MFTYINLKKKIFDSKRDIHLKKNQWRRASLQSIYTQKRNSRVGRKIQNKLTNRISKKDRV